MIVYPKWGLHKKPNGFDQMLENEGMYWKLIKWRSVIQKRRNVSEVISKWSDVLENSPKWKNVLEIVSKWRNVLNIFKNEGMY